MSDEDAGRARRPLASVYITAGGDVADSWLVAETPAEAMHVLAAALEAGVPFAELTLANPLDPDAGHRWNGRTVYVRAEHVTAISPPQDALAGDD